MIIADENLDAKIIAALRQIPLEVYSIAERHSGFSDEEVITIARQENGIIITRDKDFGEWVFAHHIRGVSVILLRYRFIETDAIITRLLRLFNSDPQSLIGKFTTLTVSKSRSRNIP